MDAGKGAAPFGRRLRDLRIRAGLSQQQLARSSTLSIRAIRDLENGRVRHPRADSLRLLAGALGLSAHRMKRLAEVDPLDFPAGVAEPTVNGPFIGREPELAALTTMLGAEHHRLITITGIEGVGKTRLAREVAHALEAAGHVTVVWLSLDDAPSGGGRAAAGSPERSSGWSEFVRSGPDGRRRLAETIGESNVLLVLDGAGPQDNPDDVTTDLLAACPQLRILVTTRNPMDVSLDTLFPLAPLAVPACDAESADLKEVASVALLLGQVKRLQPALCPDLSDLADVARICRALDGLPGALESAAHWSLVYSPRQLALQLSTEPFTVARRPQGSHRRPDAYASVHDTIATLSTRQRDLVWAMSSATAREEDGYRSVAQVADTMGLTAAECADDIYCLYVRGILRRVDHHDVATFKVLNIVSDALRNTIAGQHAAA